MELGAPAALGTAVIAALLASTPSLAGDPPVEPLAVSRETTWITEPLRSDGTPDYPAWLTRRYATGVTSENNAATVLLQLRMIGGVGDVAPLEKELKARLDERGTVPGIGHLPADFAAVFAAQHRRALLGPWDEVDAPLIAAWLRVNEAWLCIAPRDDPPRPGRSGCPPCSAATNPF